MSAKTIKRTVLVFAIALCLYLLVGFLVTFGGQGEGGGYGPATPTFSTPG